MPDSIDHEFTRADARRPFDMSRNAKIAIAAVVLFAAAFAGGYFLIAGRGDDNQPDPVSLDSSGLAPATSSDSGSGAAGGSADGTWQVQQDENTFLGYRVQEKLAFNSEPNVAVGRTPQVTGTMTVAGAQVSAARIEGDLSQLKSDQDRRDNAIRSNGLETGQFPSATFELSEPISLPEAPAQGKTYNAQAKGKLTIHGQSQDTTIPLQARWDGSTISVAGSQQIRMTDYGITPPKLGPVAEIQDTGTIEIKLVFAKG
jgi:polyisoprenoid-binding protein YceI